jgi:hypothetical protein
MRSFTLLLTTISTLVIADSEHGNGHGLPKLVGGKKFMTNLKSRNMFTDAIPSLIEERGPVTPEKHIEARVTETCGPGVGNCDAGYCCSEYG